MRLLGTVARRAYPMLQKRCTSCLLIDLLTQSAYGEFCLCKKGLFAAPLICLLLVSGPGVAR